jgi:hypothetical protein
MRLELDDAYDGDEGAYIRVTLGAGDVEAEVTVEDGMHGKKVTVTVDGEVRTLRVPSPTK